MKMHYKKFLYGLLLMIFLILVSILLCTIIQDKTYFDIIVLVFLLCITIIITILFILEFIGHKEYFCDETNIIIKRKNKIIEIIGKDKIANLTKIFDIITGDLIMIVVEYEEKKRKIPVTRDNRSEISLLTKDIPSKMKKNFFYYLIMLLIYR